MNKKSSASNHQKTCSKPCSISNKHSLVSGGLMSVRPSLDFSVSVAWVCMSTRLHFFQFLWLCNCRQQMSQVSCCAPVKDFFVHSLTATRPLQTSSQPVFRQRGTFPPEQLPSRTSLLHCGVRVACCLSSSTLLTHVLYSYAHTFTVRNFGVGSRSPFA